jgi:hypothetical protein
MSTTDAAQLEYISTRCHLGKVAGASSLRLAVRYVTGRWFVLLAVLLASM